MCGDELQKVQLRIQQMFLRQWLRNLRRYCWVGLLLISSGSFAKEINCSADQGENSKGWIPSQFILDIADGTYYLSCWMTMAKIDQMKSKKVIFQNLNLD